MVMREIASSLIALSNDNEQANVSTRTAMMNRSAQESAANSGKFLVTTSKHNIDTDGMTADGSAAGDGERLRRPLTAQPSGFFQRVCG